MGAEETGQRMSVFETIKLFFTLADTQLLNEMFDKAFGRANDDSTEAFVRDSCLELVRAMLSYIDKTRVKMMYEMGLTQLASKDHKVQKRSYRVLEELCGSNSEGKGKLQCHICPRNKVFVELFLCIILLICI